MKQLTCEMCGSTDLLKQEGVFVCQSCGCKYSVEEAKKMMVEVAGAVEVKNAAQLDNLLNLARSSFESKNYAQAEDFCNQVIAMDDKNYEAWKIKGEAINYQINAKNQRILEVYNCMMTSFRVLDEEGKQEKGPEILFSLRDCLFSEVSFWLKHFEAARPTDTALLRVIDAYKDARAKLSDAYDEILCAGLDEKAKEVIKGLPLSNFDNAFINKCNIICVSAWKSTVAYNYYRDYMNKGVDPFGREQQKYIINFDNAFINKCNIICVSAWKSTVAYNYYRDYMNKGVDPFGREQQKYIIDSTDVYRPLEKTWDTFLNESDNLIDLLKFAERCFDAHTSAHTKKTLYGNIIYIQEYVIPSGSWKITQGYKGPHEQFKSVGWWPQYRLADDAKKARRKEIQHYTVIPSGSWKITQGYKGPHEQFKSVGWWPQYRLADDAKKARRKEIQHYTELKNKVDIDEKNRQRKAEEKERRERIEAYWAEHHEEKKALEEEEDRLTQRNNKLNEDIAAIEKKNGPRQKELRKKQDEPLPVEDELNKQRALIRELEEQRDQCGFFKGKEKRALQARIDNEETPRLEQLKQQADAERRALHKEINEELQTMENELKPLADEREQLKKRLQEIHDELTRDRKKKGK